MRRVLLLYGFIILNPTVFAPTLVLYTTMMMKQYHFKHFYANFDFDHFPLNFMKKIRINFLMC